MSNRENGIAMIDYAETTGTVTRYGVTAESEDAAREAVTDTHADADILWVDSIAPGLWEVVVESD